MKKIFIALTLLIVSISMSAQTVSTHTVKHGETIQGIAQKYAVSVEDLKIANPEINEYFYIGMKLNIPATTQKINNTSNRKETSYNQSVENSIIAYHYPEIGYEWDHLAIDDGGYARNFNMLNIGYHVGFNVTSKLPNLKVETGLNFAFGSSKNTQYNVLNKPLHVDYNISYLKLPIVVAYNFNVNDYISIMPSVGAYAKYYLKATSKDYSDDKDVQAAYKYYGMTLGEETNKFDQKKEDYNWKRFGCGIQIGVNCVIKKHLLVGAQYSYEFTKIDPKFGYNFTHGINAKIGWVF